MTIIEAKKILLAAELSPTVREAINTLSPDLDFQNLPGEEWRDVADENVDCNEYYQVSNCGRVRSFKQGKVKLIKLQISRQNGYVYVGFYSKGRKVLNNFLVHSIVAKTFIPKPKNKSQVNHIDGNKQNNHVSNLAWVTPSENIQHAYENGLAKKGCSHCRAVLTYEQVREIRRDCVPGDPERGIKAFARKFNVSDSVISNVYHRRTYKDVE